MGLGEPGPTPVQWAQPRPKELGWLVEAEGALVEAEGARLANPWSQPIETVCSKSLVTSSCLRTVLEHIDALSDAGSESTDPEEPAEAPSASLKSSPCERDHARYLDAEC
mmetsp:Transcript_115242/g.366350  ORF Transcript_115242/g.366350 Transcript_115242/m.366350 type:complete len:110 (+) Transcript_115242:412-741(+)